MNYTKIFGWIVIAAGLLIIGWSLFSAVNVFTGKQLPPEIFKEQKAVVAPQGKISPQDIQAQLQNMIGEQLKSMLPADTLPKLMNLTVYSMLIFLLFSGGSQVASIGIKLLKS